MVVHAGGGPEQNGRLEDVIPDTPAALAGLAPGMQIRSVNGKTFSANAMNDAINSAQNNSKPIAIMASNSGFVRSYDINYHGGQRYPHLDARTRRYAGFAERDAEAAGGRRAEFELRRRSAVFSERERPLCRMLAGAFVSEFFMHRRREISFARRRLKWTRVNVAMRVSCSRRCCRSFRTCSSRR